MTAWVRWASCNLVRMLPTWVLTVSPLITRVSAISRLVRPRAFQARAEGDEGDAERGGEMAREVGTARQARLLASSGGFGA